VGLSDLRGREGEPEVRGLLALAHGSGSSLERALERYRARTWILVGWEEEARLVACAGVERDGTDIVVRSLAVEAESRGRGVGRSLLDGLAGVATARRLVAETDDDAVGFYERCGFTADEIEPKGGRRRYRCSRPIGAGAAPAELVRAITLGDLEEAIRSAWSRDTSDDPDEWSEENPARGQCAVTALLVQELLGGEILIANVLRDGERVERHGWNRLPSGVTVDLTRSQFSNGEEFEEPAVGEPVLASRDRYELLARRVRDRLSL
jgi:GNAT superfamily N-acetyltransferase